MQLHPATAAAAHSTHERPGTSHTLDLASPVAKPVFLMCAPELYDVHYVINPWMAGNVHRSSRDRALAQWQQLHRELSRIAQVELIAPVAGSPDMVFTANAGLIRGHDAILSSFFHPERQGEEPHFRRWFAEAGYTVRELPRETPFEGEGDALFSEDGARLWIGHGPRTSSASHRGIAEVWPSVTVSSLHLVDPRFYHLDTCFAPLTGGHLLYYPAAFDHTSLVRIESFYAPDKRIAVSEADAARFACNAVNVGGTLLLNTISSGLRTLLTARGFHVVEIPLDEFLKAGGAAKCLVMRLHPALHAVANDQAAAAAAHTFRPAATVLPNAAELIALSLQTPESAARIAEVL